MVISKENKIHPTNGIVIRYKGAFDLDSLYKSVKSWFPDNNYDYYEKENTEKVKPQGNSVILKMNGVKDIDDYVQFRIDVIFEEVLRIKKLEKGHYSEIRAIIKAVMILDHRNKWKSYPFMFYLYNNIILKKKIMNYYWPKIYNEMMNLNSLIKSRLNLIE